MVQDPADGEVDVISVRHGRMSARGPVRVRAFDRRADARPPAIHLERVLVGMALVRSVEMAVVQVVGMIAVLDGAMAAFGAVPARAMSTPTG